MSYILLGSSGLEPPTSRLSGARSNQLSYEPAGRPASKLGFLPALLESDLTTIWSSLGFTIRLEMMGFEPMTPCLQGRCSPNWATPPCGFRGSVFSFQWTNLSVTSENPSGFSRDRQLTYLPGFIPAIAVAHWKLNNICTLCTPIRWPSCNAICSSP